MPELRIGVQAASLGIPLRQALPLLAEWGVQSVELDARRGSIPADTSQTALRQLRKLLSDYRLRVAAVSYSTRRGYDEPDELDRRIDGTKRAMRFAAAVGARVVINRIGRIPESADGEPWRLLTQVLHDLGRFGQHTGALLAAETGDESGPALAKLLAALPTGYLGVDLHPANLLCHGHSPLEAIEALGHHIFHVHVADAVLDRSRGRGQFVPLGRGMCDWPELLGALEERDYRGDFTLECRDSPDPVKELGAAVQYLRSL